ncbi:hypothetical protein ACK1CN_25015 [Vibrio coralliilyticus]|uniref:gp53-like domain-containing protein n=1 Tax=Vibrio coralliilyticus TaxID=190893 RepID=UPI003916D1B4
MSTLQAIPTQHGIDILNSELKNTVTKYRLIGALTHDAPSESLYSFYENTIETSYYDDNGVLTFILNLPIEQHFDEYLHQIHVLDSSNQSVIECSTPKVALPKGIGGMVTLKAAISGEAGQVIFKHGEFVTETELNELFLPQKENVNNAATDDDIDNESAASKHIKLPQLWRALTNKLTLGFSIQLSQNGFIAFPDFLGGLILQWGSGQAAANNSVPGHANALPMAYPTKQCVAIAIHTGGDPSTTNVINNSLTTTHAYFESSNSSVISIMYISLGY